MNNADGRRFGDFESGVLAKQAFYGGNTCEHGRNQRLVQLLSDMGVRLRLRPRLKIATTSESK